MSYTDGKIPSIKLLNLVVVGLGVRDSEWIFEKYTFAPLILVGLERIFPLYII